MNENNIQKGISLVGFKAVRMEYQCGITEEEIDEKSVNTFDLQLDDILYHNDPDIFAKAFVLSLKVLGLEKEIISINLEYHTLFKCGNNIDEEFMKSDFARISAPAIGFPFVRAFVTNLSAQAGIPPIYLPSINFVNFNENLKKKEIESETVK